MRMLDLAAPAAALGYGVGRIGCLLSGDGDYGINTTLPWGVHMMNGTDKWHRALVMPEPPTAAVQPTPIYELLFSLLVFWLLWELGRRVRPVGWMTGTYLVLSGIGRFLVEFVRINPKLYFGKTMSNAQVAALGSILAGAILMIVAFGKNVPWMRENEPAEQTA
jgi:phosphatidylglycerol:prolipoprotein diacylglycerol transferase